MPSPTIIRGNGKLLITAEYLVLDGATALAVPTRLGQTLSIEPIDQNQLEWESLDCNANRWFSAKFNPRMEITFTDNLAIAQPLQKILRTACELNPSFRPQGQKAITRLEFDRQWGLGSSSTLIHTVARWAQIDPFRLLDMTFGGSGYDIACASSYSPILYRRADGKPQWKPTEFRPPFAQELYFVYLGHKQDTRCAIASYRSADSKRIPESIQTIDLITTEIISCTDPTIFERLITEHERILSDILGIEPVKQRLFADYEGAIKSLGAWGGDFVLACGKQAPQYFSSKGYSTIIPYREMVYGE